VRPTVCTPTTMPGRPDNWEAAVSSRSDALTQCPPECHYGGVVGRSRAGRSGFSAPADENASRLQQLARVTTELGAAESIDAVVEAAVTHMAEAIHAAVTTLMIRDGDKLVLVSGHGLRPGVLERWHSFSLDDANPASEAVRDARPVLVNDHATIAERYPSLLDDVPAGRSIVCLPLGAGSAPVGVAGLTFEDGWLPGPAELDLLTTFAEACGQAIRRIRAAAEAAERTQQLRFLADASAELSRSLDYRSTLSKVATLCVPGLADWCAVDVVDRESLTTLAVAHVDPEKVAWAWELQRRYPPDPDSMTGPPNVARTGHSELYEVIDDKMLQAAARDEDHLRLTRELKLRSAMVVPLKVRGRTLGAITLIRAETGRSYTTSDLAVAEELGRRAGNAIDNAHQHSETRDVARQLQRAVLPDNLDAIPGWHVAAHYEPGGTAEVGGDFYDAVPLPDGRLAVFIGDVMGHGVAAAAAMANLRASVRAFISVDPAPGAVLEHLEQLFSLLSLTRLVSLVYGIIDPASTSLEIVNAGHYPPLIIRKDGDALFAQTPPRRPLGTDPDSCTASDFPFDATDTLLLYTDGLVERREEHIDIGLQRIQSGAEALAGTDLVSGLQALVSRVHDDEGEDDVTALAVRSA
jgi:serine phosphatase RsbU (regulator of sigma subunit)